MMRQLLHAVTRQEVTHQVGDCIAMGFQREVPGIDQVEVHFLQILLIRIRPGGREDLVVLAPDDQDSGLRRRGCRRSAGSETLDSRLSHEVVWAGTTQN